MYHIFFIPSSVDRHLGCFRVLAIVYCAVMNFGYVYLFESWFFILWGFLRGRLHSVLWGQGSRRQHLETPQSMGSALILGF